MIFSCIFYLKPLLFSAGANGIICRQYEKTVI